MKAFGLLLLLSVSSAFAQENVPFGYKKSCPQLPLPQTPRPLSDFSQQFSDNNISVLQNNNVDTRNVERFLSELEKFPLGLRNEMKARGARITLMEGNGVTVDPSFSHSHTHDGRGWDSVPGSGGEVSRFHNIPTRIVINHLYDQHGANNLILHEHAHTLDSLYGRHGLSATPTFRNLLRDTPRSDEFLRMLCTGTYCSSSPVEAFAELFAYYYGCEETKRDMEEKVPQIAEFFRNFNSARDLLDGRMPASVPAPVPDAPENVVTTTTEDCDTPTKDITAKVKPLTDVTDFMRTSTDLLKTTGVIKPMTSLKRSGSASAGGMK